MNPKDEAQQDTKNPARSGRADHGQGKGGEEHGGNFVTVSIDQASRNIHRGSYTVEQLKGALGVAADRELDIIEDGKIRSLPLDERLVVREGMEFVSRQPSGGASW